MQKLRDWEQRLHYFFSGAQHMEHKWGAWDCCIFADTAIKEMAGAGIIPADLKWHDRRTAFEAIKKAGGDLQTAVSSIATKAGLIRVNDLKKGDLVVYQGKKTVAVGIYDGFGIRCPTEHGSTVVKKDKALEAFRING